MRLEIQVTSGYLPWANKGRASKEIDLQNLFNDYWTSKADELALLGQSWFPISSILSDRETQRSWWLESINAL